MELFQMVVQPLQVHLQVTLRGYNAVVHYTLTFQIMLHPFLNIITDLSEN